MSNPNLPDGPEFTQGDVVEIFNPETQGYQWITVEEVLTVNGAQLLKGSGLASFVCACLVNLDSLSQA